MAGRPKKPADQARYERELKDRLVALRKNVFQTLGEVDGRRAFAEKCDISETAYEKLEQRGALSALHVVQICRATGANPFEFLEIDHPAEQLSTSAVRLAFIHDQLDDEHQKLLMANAQAFPPARKPRARHQRDAKYDKDPIVADDVDLDCLQRATEEVAKFIASQKNRQPSRQTRLEQVMKAYAFFKEEKQRTDEEVREFLKRELTSNR